MLSAALAALLFVTALADSGQECASLYQQCGGQGYDGPACCVGDATCLEIGPFYSQCILESIREEQGPGNTTNSTSADTSVYGQCGGRNYDGDTSCPEGFTCVPVSDFFSQCVIESPGCVLTNNQCGGDTYVGPTECCEGLTCARPINATDDSYLQCRTDGPNVEPASNSLVDTSDSDSAPPPSPPATRSLPPTMADTPMMADAPAMGPMGPMGMPDMAPGPADAPTPGGALADGTGGGTSRSFDAPAAAPGEASGTVSVSVGGTALGAIALAAAAVLAL